MRFFRLALVRLGDGIRLLDARASDRVEREPTAVRWSGKLVTLHYRVLK